MYDETWSDRAACAALPLSWFFEDAYEEAGTGAASHVAAGFQRARSVCSECPVRLECFTAAMAEECEPEFFIDGPRPSVRHGIRGGLTPQQRESVFKRKVQSCEVCGETYDPLGVVAGDVVCACGWFEEPPIHERGDTWGLREDAVLGKIRSWVLGHTRPGSVLPAIGELKLAVGDHRKDGVARFVLEKLADDGLLERRGEGHKLTYVRRAGKQAMRRWVPPARRRAA